MWILFEWFHVIILCFIIFMLIWKPVRVVYASTLLAKDYSCSENSSDIHIYIHIFVHIFSLLVAQSCVEDAILHGFLERIWNAMQPQWSSEFLWAAIMDHDRHWFSFVFFFRMSFMMSFGPGSCDWCASGKSSCASGHAHNKRL